MKIMHFKGRISSCGTCRTRSKSQNFVGELAVLTASLKTLSGNLLRSQQVSKLCRGTCCAHSKSQNFVGELAALTASLKTLSGNLLRSQQG